MSRDFGTDRLHALVDGELNAADKARLLEEMDRDPLLRQQVWNLYKVKGYVACAFENPPPAPTRRRHAGAWQKAGLGIAAALLLAVGFAGGRWSAPPLQAAATDPNHVILHVSTADEGKFLEALADAEKLAARSTQVEIVTNGGGLDLVRSDRSPVAGRVRTLIERHPNVQLVACNITINRERERGERPVLIEGTQIAPSAGDYILGRLEQGWTYLRV